MSDLEQAAQQALEALGEIEWSNNSQWQSDRARGAITTLRQALEQQTADRHIKLVPIRQLFDELGNQVCSTSEESCHFLVPAISPNYVAACNHCQRGIPDNKPHRLCPVWFQSCIST